MQVKFIMSPILYCYNFDKALMVLELKMCSYVTFVVGCCRGPAVQPSVVDE